MAKHLLAKFNAKFKIKNKKLSTRGQMLKENLVEFKIYFSLVPFVMIRFTKEELDNIKKNNKEGLKCDILDQTRIHHEHYKLAMKIATDACSRSEGNEETQEVAKAE